MVDKHSAFCDLPLRGGIVAEPAGSRGPNCRRIINIGVSLAFLLVSIPSLQAFAQILAPPTITAITPSNVPAASSSVLTVLGANFTPQSSIQLSGSPRPTVYVSDSQLTASLTPADTAASGTLAVSVSTPGAGTSATVRLNVVAASAAANPTPPGNTLRYVPHFVEGGGFITKLTLVNLTNSNNQIWVNFLGQDGTVVETMGYLLAAAATARVEAPESVRLGPTVTKWAVVGSQGAIGVNTFFELGGGANNVTNTVGFNDALTGASLTLPVEFSASGRTVGLAIANPSSNIIHATLQLSDQNGTALATSAVDLPPNGQTAMDLSNIAAFKTALPASNFIGTVTISASSPIAAIALGDDMGPFFSTPPLGAGRSGQIVIPHIVSGDGFVTKLTFIDMSGSSNALDVRFYDQGGNLLQEQPLTLAPHGVARISTPEASRFGNSQTTWAVVTAANAAAVNLFFELEESVTNRVINVLGFNDAPSAADFTIPVEFLPAAVGGGSGRTVGLALANASSTTATITATLVDQSGRVVATAPLSLPKNTQIAIDLATMPAFAAALPPQNFIGVLTISSSTPISAIALGDDFGPFYATPVIAGRAGSVSVASVLPEVGSSAGGTAVTVTGIGFVAGATVSFGGTPAATVTVVNSTTLRVITPPHATTAAAAIAVTNPDGGIATLASGFDYEPAATTTYFSTNFEDGTLGNLRADTDLTSNCVTPFSQTSVFATGSHSAQTGGNTGNGNVPCNPSRLHYQFCSGDWPFNSGSTPCNPGAANPNGYYVRFWLTLDQNAIDNCTHQQCKLFLNRFNPDVSAPSFNWIVLGLGYQLGGGGTHILANQVDSGLVSPNNARFAATFLAGVPKEVECQFVRNTATHIGTVNCWIDGRRWWSQTDPTLGSDNLADQQSFEVGLAVYEQGGLDAGTGLPWIPAGQQHFVYVDDVAAANGWIEN